MPSQADSMSTPFYIAQYFVLALVGIMTVAFVVLVIIRLCDKKPKPMMSERSFAVLGLSFLGIPVFLAGLLLVFLPQLGHINLGVALVCGGILAAFASAFLNAMLAKSKRAAWPVIPARCTKRRLEKKRFAAEGGNADGWSWLLACELDYGGKQYLVTPKVHWSDLGQADAPFWSEEKAQQYISQRISPTGECKLRVNPADPREVELL
jgi:hypothetical protein